jgi:hypothetical protein
MKPMSTAARHLSWQSPQISAPALTLPHPKARGGLGALITVVAFLPIWLPRELQVGNFSFAFAVPFALALWAMTRPASVGSIQRALRGAHARGLWLEVLCAVAIAMLAAMTTLYSPEPLNAFRVILPMTYGICALVLFCRISPLATRRWACAPLFAGCLALGFGLVFEHTSSGRLALMRDYRFLGFFENPNQLGIMIVGVWPLAIALLLNARTARSRLVSAALVLVLAGSILMSGTKTALALGFVSGTLMWLYHSSRSGTLAATLFRLAITLSIVVAAVPAILWVISWASPAFFARVNSILTNGVWAFPSMQARGAIWQTSLQTGLANPLFGVGAGTEVYGYAHSHNMLLDYFRGMGVLALSAAVVLILSVVSRCASFLLSTWYKRESNRSSDTLVAGMYLGATFHLFANQLSDSFSPTTAFLFWMMYFGGFFIARSGTPFAPPVPRPSTIGWSARVKPEPEFVTQPD